MCSVYGYTCGAVSCVSLFVDGLSSRGICASMEGCGVCSFSYTCEMGGLPHRWRTQVVHVRDASVGVLSFFPFDSSMLRSL